MTRRRRWITIAAAAAALAAVGVLVASQAGLALPPSLAAYFFGPKMVRAEVVVKEDGVVHDYRIDRGRIRTMGPNWLTLAERDGTVATVRVASGARVTVNGVAVTLSSLQRGMMVTAIRDGDAPASTVQATAKR